jgi:hypothetical protein
MIKLSIGKQKGEVIEHWSELTLQQGIELHKIAFRFPKVVKEMYALSFQENVNDKISELEATLPYSDYIKKLPKLYGELIDLLTTFEPTFIRKLPPRVRTDFFNKFLLKFVLGILFFPIDLKVEKLAQFEHKGTVYELPKDRIIQLGTQIFDEPFAEGTAIEFTEVADLEIAAKGMEGGRFEMAANIIAILCRPEDEVYDENTSLQRVNAFMTLPMDTVWQVFFCITESFNMLNDFTRIYLNQVARPKATVLT